MRDGLGAALALAIGGLLSATAACDQRVEAGSSSPTPPASPAVAAATSVVAQDPGPLDPMPSAQQKRALAAQFDPRRPWFSPYLTTAEVTESKGFFIQYLEAADDSRAERQGWAGYARYVALERSRQHHQAQGEAARLDEKAAREARDLPEVQELCRRFQANPEMGSAEITRIHERLEQLAIPYPSQLSICATSVRFRYLETLDQVCTAAPC